jgi:hypothetical protein
MEFYTYLWLREDGTPYYVGKGCGGRAFTSKGHRQRRPEDADRIILQYWPCESDAFAAEVFLIAYYGRQDLGSGRLCNMSDGGDGRVGWSEEQKSAVARLAVSQNRQAFLNTPQANAKKVAFHTGRKRTASTRQKISEKAKERTGERNSFFGKTHTPESLAKMSVPHLQRRGVKRPEHAAFMRAYWQNKENRN